MKDVTSSNFGFLIAYLAPGFTTLWGLSEFSPMLRAWLDASASAQPTVGGFLFVTVASVAIGVTVSAVRWAVVDSVLHATGIRPPELDFSKLRDSGDGFHVLIEIHYRYFQFYSNMIVALAVLYVGWKHTHGWAVSLGWTDLTFVVIELILFAGARDTMSKYYRRTEQLLRPVQRRSSFPFWLRKPLFQLFHKRRQRRAERLQNRA